MASEPKTLQEALIYFADPKHCREYLVARRWPNGVTCPRCGSDKVAFLEKYNRWQCNAKSHTNRQFTSKTGTIFEDSPLGLDKWLAAMWLIVNCKNGISSYEVGRDLGVSQKSAWHMLHRIRLAMQGKSAAKLGKSGSPIEADETFIGGKVANMHLDKQTRARMGKKRIGGFEGKMVVMGLLERHGEARVKVLQNTRAFHVRTNVIENVEKGSIVYSDSLRSYRNLPVDGFVHEFIDHTEAYVRGEVHTNGLENFWSLLKRSLKGTYVSVEPFHLQAYCDEQAFRFNNRKDMTDSDRFDLAVRQIVGKRLTWAEVTGKVIDSTSVN
jgi:transposase-like protein